MKKGISLVLAITLSFASVTVLSVKADELTDAQKQLNNIKGSIDDKKEELDSINKEKASTEKALKGIEEKMKVSSATLSDLNSRLSNLGVQVASLEKQIVKSETSLKEQNELFKKRIRAMYINGNESYLDLILSSDSFSEFLARIDSLKKVVEYDKKLIASIDTQKKALETQKVEIEKKKKETTALKQQADVKHKELQASSNEKKTIMAELVKDKIAYEKAIKEEEDQSKAIASMINQIKKRREEEQKKQQQNGGSSNNAALGKIYCVTGKPVGITSPYGWRVHPVLGNKRFHAGIDIGVFSGTAIYALADGEVIYSGWMSGYGNVIMIDHGSLTSVYAHNSSLVGKVGEKVKGGQLIAYSGNTGLSSGPHLHFEMRKENGETIDPNPYYVK